MISSGWWPRLELLHYNFMKGLFYDPSKTHTHPRPWECPGDEGCVTKDSGQCPFSLWTGALGLCGSTAVSKRCLVFTKSKAHKTTLFFGCVQLICICKRESEKPFGLRLSVQVNSALGLRGGHILGRRKSPVTVFHGGV
jgi:hypothetical protein